MNNRGIAGSGCFLTLTAFLDPAVFTYFADCDEVWHAGDFGPVTVHDQLEAFKPLRSVGQAVVPASLPMGRLRPL